jgi:hypothetical protein
VAIGQYNSLSLAGSSNIAGTAYVDKHVTVSTKGNSSITGGTSLSNLGPAASAASNFSQSAPGLGDHGLHPQRKHQS